MAKTSMSRRSPEDLPRVSPTRRVGQVGESWGNLLIEIDGMSVDDEFVFESEATAATPIFRVTRVLPFPLDKGKRLAYYQKVSA